MAPKQTKSLLVDELDLERVRAAFPILQKAVYLNTGTYGPMPEPALNTLLAAVTEIERGGVAASGEPGELYAAARRHAAARLKADVEEITFTRNATDGINLAVYGLDWREGEEILTTDEEHEGMLHPLLYLQKHRGVRIRRLAVSSDAGEMRDRLEQAVTPRTRLIAFSHVSCESGTRLPAEAICRWAAARQILTLADGAHTLGVFPLDVRQIGCDFYACNGHKWLHGPTGTGLFYARRDRLTELSPVIVGAGSLERVDAETGEAQLWNTAARFECGTRSWTLYVGLGASMDWLEGLGWERVTAHIARQSGVLKDRLAARSDVCLLTPRAWEQSAGLVAFRTPDRDAGAVCNALRARHIYVRHVPHYNAVRIATAHFTDGSDLDRLLTALDDID